MMCVPRTLSNFMFSRKSVVILNCKRLFSISSTLFKKKQINSHLMNNLYIRYDEGADTFQALFLCKYESLNVEREFNFNRKIVEPVDDFISRIRANLDKILTKKSKRGAKKKSNNDDQIGSPAADIHITVKVDGENFATSKTCKELFLDKNKSDIQFSILNKSYPVVLNSPWVDTLTLPCKAMANFPVYPIKLELFSCELTRCRFLWYTSNDVKGPWKEAGEGFVFTPSEDIISSNLKVICIPSNGKIQGPEKESTTSCAIISGPGPCPFEDGHKFTENRLDDSGIRIVSYNILADSYAETDVAKTELFSYCAPHALTLEYRKQLYLKELLGYYADVICLQEVDEKVFHNDLLLFLGQQEMKGIFCVKGGTIHEGVTTFFSTKKYRLLDSYRVILGEEVDKNIIFKPIWDKLKVNEAAAANLKERSSVLQVLVLERLSNTRDKLIVANTHLYFHPDADHLRLVQTGLCMQFIDLLVNELKCKNGEDRYSLVFCGDFNSSPDCGAYQLMTTKHVPSDFKDWKANSAEIIEGLELRQPFSIESAYGTPKYTNFTAGFADCLDYIYYQTDYLQLEQVVPLPSEEILRRDKALPSVVFPSDHIALIADFIWL